jgi:hypothetical protein
VSSDPTRKCAYFDDSLKGHISARTPFRRKNKSAKFKLLVLASPKCGEPQIQTEYAMKKNKWDSVKAFAIELVNKKTKAQQKRSEPSGKAFAIELAIFTALVVFYFFLVLSFLSNWLRNLFDQNKLVYALVAWALIAAQGVVLEVIAAALLKVV